jgi:hypothetical protein
MSFSAIIARTTRKLHSIAVSAHVAALRGTVKAANVEARSAQSVARLAKALTDHALDFEHTAESAATAAANRACTVKAAASQEATNIGGVL